MLILAAILGILVYGIVAATWGTLNSTLGFNDAQNGAIALAQAVGLVVASISVGPLIDLKGKKVALVGGLALIAGSLFWLPSAGRDYTTTTICLAVLGLGGGIVVTGANALVSDVTESRRGTALNLLNLFFGLGGLLTPFVTANLLSGNAIRMCYLAAALAAAALVVNAITPMPRPTGERGFKASELGALFGRPALYLLSLFLFLYVACEVGVWNWLGPYLIHERGLNRASALNILSLGFALGLLVGRVVVSRILMNASALTVTLIAACAMAATTYGMLQAATVTGAWIAVFCAGLAMAPIFPTTLAMVGDAFPRMSATAMGVVITSGWIGLAVSSPIIGNVAHASGLHTALLLLPIFSVAMVLVNVVMRPLLRTLAANRIHPPRVAGGHIGFEIIGGLAGALVGYLVGTSPILSFGDVLTRGMFLEGLNALLRPAAQSAFNYTLAGAIVGVVGGLGLSRLLGARSPAPGASARCPHCGVEVPNEMEFCGKCGQGLRATICSECGKAVPQNRRSCGSCGAKIDAV